MRKVFALIVLAALVLSAVSCDKLKKTVYVCGACKNEVGPNDKNCSSCGASIVITNENDQNIVYTEVTIKAISELQEQNAARAEEQYAGQYIQIAGTISRIDVDCSFELCDRSEDETDLILLPYLRSASCKPITPELKDVILNLNKGDNVTVKGKITNIQSEYISLLDLEIEVHAIEVD